MTRSGKIVRTNLLGTCNATTEKLLRNIPSKSCDRSAKNTSPRQSDIVTARIRDMSSPVSPSPRIAPEVLRAVQDAWDSLEEEGHFKDDVSDLHLVQNSEFVAYLPGPVGIDFEDGKLVIGVDHVKHVCSSATRNADNAANLLLHFAGLHDSPKPYIEMANICFTGPVGGLDSRRALWKVGMAILREAISTFWNNASVLCAYGAGKMRDYRPRYNNKYNKGIPDKVCQILSKAELLNSVEATFEKACVMGEASKDLPFMDTTPIDHLLEAVSKGFPAAFVALARVYARPKVLNRFNLKVTRNKHNRCIRDLLQCAADAGNAEGIDAMGHVNDFGLYGATRSLEKSVECYAEAIRKGYTGARRNLGKLYETGMDGHAMCFKDVEKAKTCYWSGARLKCPVCTVDLVLLLESEIGDDPVKADEVEELYRNLLWDTEHDSFAGFRLKGLLITEEKMHSPLSERAKDKKQRLKACIYDPQKWQKYYGYAESSIMKLINQNDVQGSSLAALLGVPNAQRLLDHANKLIRSEDARSVNNKLHRSGSTNNDEFRHVFGSALKQVNERCYGG